jgi:hypothetical protein
VQGPYLPGYTATPDEPQISYGLQRLDHAVGNVHKLVEALEHIMGFTGLEQSFATCASTHCCLWVLYCCLCRQTALQGTRFFLPVSC